MGKRENVWKQHLNKNMCATLPYKDMNKYDARLVSFPGGILQMASLSWAFKYAAKMPCQEILSFNLVKYVST